MQPEALIQLKQRIVLLDEDSKKDLANFLAEELNGQTDPEPWAASDADRDLQIGWLKENREIYAGKYVALSGNELVGEGQTMKEANEMAKAKGVSHPFLTFVYSESEAPFGGW